MRCGTRELAQLRCRGTGPKLVVRRPSIAMSRQFYKEHCEICHRVGGIAPMAFVTYKETRTHAAAIHGATQNKSMPPWFAEPGLGIFRTIRH